MTPLQVTPQAALSLGWSVIPTKADKRPCVPWKNYQTARPSLAEIVRWQQEFHPAGWAVVTGKVSDIITLDFDGDAGCETLGKLGLAPHRKTPSGGYHVDFRHPGWPVNTVNSKSKTELGRRWPGLDIRADGGYVLISGTTERGSYAWLRQPDPEELSILPDDLRAFLGLLHPPAIPSRPVLPSSNSYHDTARVSSGTLLERALAKIPADGRNNSGFWLATQLRDNGYSESEAKPVMWEFFSYCPATNTKGQREPYTEHEMLSTLRKAFEASPREPWTRSNVNGGYKDGTAAQSFYSEPSFPAGDQPSNDDPPAYSLDPETLNDHGNAQRLKALYGNDLRYCHAMKSWLAWDGKRWKVDTTGQARRRAKLAMIDFYQRAVSAGVEKVQKFAVSSLDEKRITALLKMAESDIYVEPHELDTHPYLVNFENGTFDISTGQLREHWRSDYLTKLVQHSYVPEAHADSWLRFLDKIMGGGPDASDGDMQRAERLVSYLQRALGYSLTGDVREKAVFMCQGSGNNGKSTALSTVRSLVDEYAVQLDINTLMVRQETNNTQSDLARLRGARFAQTSETEEGQRLAEGKLKRITQGMPDGKITATRKYENSIEFNETHKLWMDCNHRPVIRGTENAIWNRLHIIPFTVTIPDEEIDPLLPSKLKQEAEGVLAWLMDGAVAWYQSGLDRPEELRMAGSEYRSEMDPLKEFLADRCVIGNQFSAPSSNLYGAYTTWAQENHETKVIDSKTFKHLMEARTFVYHRKTAGVVVEGVGLRAREKGMHDAN